MRIPKSYSWKAQAPGCFHLRTCCNAICSYPVSGQHRDIPQGPEQVLSIALVGVSERVIQSNSGFFFFFLFQSEFSTSIPWEPGCRMGGTNILSVSQNEDEKDQCYFPPWLIGPIYFSYWWAITTYWDTGEQCPNSKGHCPRGGPSTEPLIYHLSLQVSPAHAHTVSSSMALRQSYVGSRILSVYDWWCWQRQSRDDKSIARVGINSHMDDCCPVFNKRFLM